MADIQITYKGKVYDFYLVNDKGKKLWKCDDTKLLPPMFTSDRPLNAQVPPLKEDIIDQDYFYGGGGQLKYENEKQYYNSPGCDARVKGRVKCSPQIAQSTITKAASVNVHALIDWGFESNTTSFWTKTGAGTFSVVDAVAAGPGATTEGTYCGKITPAAGETNIVYQDFANYADFKGVSITATFQVWTVAGGATSDGYIEIYDGIGTTTSAQYRNTGAWTAGTVTRAIDASATCLRIQIKHVSTAAGSIAYFDKFQVTVAGTALPINSVIKGKDFSGYSYTGAGNYLLKYDGTDWDTICAFDNDITSLCVWGAYLFVAVGYSEKYWYCTAPATATTWLGSTISTGKMQFLSVVGSTMWGSSSAYEVKSATNPLNGGTWTAATTVGNSNSTITALIDHPDTVFVAERDGLFEVQAAGGVPSLIDKLAKESHSITGRALCTWAERQYVNSGFKSLYELEMASSLSNAIITTVSPWESFPTQTDFYHNVTAMEGEASWLWVAIDNGTKTEFVAGQWQIVDGTPQFIWHQLIEQTLTDTSDNVKAMWFSSLPTTRKLWIGCSHATDGIYYIDPDTNMGVSGDCLTSWHTGQYKYVLKQFYSVTLRTENCSATKTIQVLYKKEFDSSFTSLGTITSDTSTTLYFTDVTTKKIQLKFTFASDSATTSPHLLGYTLRCAARPFDLEEGRITINENYEFSMFGGLDTCWRHPEFRQMDKNFYSIEMISEGLTAAKYITLQYKLDDDAAYTTHTERFNESPYQIISFPEDTIGKEMRVKFTLASPSDTNLVAYILNGVLRPPRRKQLQFSIYLAHKQPLDGGGIATQDPDSLASLLREIDDKAWPVTLKDPVGQTHEVTFQNITEEMSIDSQLKRKEYIFTITAVEADL